MALNITITDAGKAEVIQGLNPETDPAAISEQVLALGNALAAIVEVGLGSGKYIPSKTQQNLQSEIKRVETVSGVAVSDNTLHIMIQDHSTDVYNVSEMGLYTATGTLFAVYSDPVEDFIQKTAESDLLISLDITLNDIDTATIVLGDTTFVNPPASETTSGVAKIATQDQINAGTNDLTIVTPKKLKARIDALIEAAPAALDTLNELSAALNDDPNFATTITNVLAEKLGKTETAANSEKLNGVGDSISSDINTVVKRDGDADIHARLFRSNFATQITTPASSAQVIMRNDISDNYQRPVSLAAFLNYIGGSKVSTQGWGRLGANLIIQCGYFSATNGAVNNFRIAFPSVCIAVVATPTQGGNSMAGIYTYGITRTGFQKITALDEGNPTNYGGRYIAIGY